VVSGLLADQESALLAALAAEFALTGVEEREGWLRLEAARR
jgi:ribosomal protein L11 methylase PrmA